MESALRVVSAPVFVFLEVPPAALVATAEEVQDRRLRMLVRIGALAPNGVAWHENADARFKREGSVESSHWLSLPLGLRQPICSADKEYIHYLSWKVKVLLGFFRFFKQKIPHFIRRFWLFIFKRSIFLPSLLFFQSIGPGKAGESVQIFPLVPLLFAVGVWRRE